jgi:hypothetical protein
MSLFSAHKCYCSHVTVYQQEASNYRSLPEQSATAVNMGDNKEEIEVVRQNFVCCLLGELIQQYAEKLDNYGWGIKGGWQSLTFEDMQGC